MSVNFNIESKHKETQKIDPSSKEDLLVNEKIDSLFQENIGSLSESKTPQSQETRPRIHLETLDDAPFRLTNTTDPSDFPKVLIFQKSDSSKEDHSPEFVSAWTKRYLDRRKRVAEKCWELFVVHPETTKKEGKDSNGLRSFLSESSENPKEVEELFDRALKNKDFSAFLTLFNPLSDYQIRLINDKEKLDISPLEK